jgi:hypothetical protein
VHQNLNAKDASSGVAPDELSTGTLKPALASIPNAQKYMGDPSRSKFYADVLPQLDTVHIGRRHFVVVASMDRLIATLLSRRVSAANSLGSKPPRLASLKSYVVDNNI